ncbi:metal-dependent hydrolase [Massilia sp. TSP1-1-2]|uniref:metal-dependent hydrolase n=1 Tax=Massilia sp. TSP1-1-2 TaxID=2804649 RepID=UPI003CEBC5E7
MPTIITHAAIPLAIGLGLGSSVVSRRLLLAGVAASMLPDADVLGFHLGVPYGHALGHRGVSHALVSAVLMGLTAALGAPWIKSTRLKAFLFVAICMASHGVLDMLTDGGKGVALFWPFSEQRHFFPWRPVAVSPLGLDRILSRRGLEVALSELRWVWLPALTACATMYFGVRPLSRNSFLIGVRPQDPGN